MWRESDVEKIVTIATDRDPREMFGPNTAVLVRTVSALMAARVEAPEEAPQHYGGHSGYEMLSVREKDVLLSLAQGYDNVGIAHKLGIAEVTVRMHLRNCRRKMGAATREQALAFALARGAIHL